MPSAPTSTHPGHATPASDTVVHLLGRVTDDMASHVAMVTGTLAEGGMQQTLILLDDPERRHLLAKFDARVRLVLCKVEGRSGGSLWALLDLLCAEAQSAHVTAVHLHGLLPCVLGGYAARFRALPAPLHFSPSGARVRPPSRVAAALLLWTLRPRRGEPARRTITGRAAEVATLQQITGLPVDLVENSVDSRFFGHARREARRPLVVTASRSIDPRGAALFAQLAVLLGEEALHLSFNWVGPADAESVAQLAAAGVGHIEPADDTARIARLNPTWVFVAGDSGKDFPRCLVEAMALGLPCVARATPRNREVLRHGETGLLCRSEDEMLAGVASLVDSTVQRAALGKAAREEAMHRFHRSTQRAALMASYQAPAPQRPATLPETEMHTPPVSAQG